MKKILMGYKFKPEGFKSLEGKFEMIYPEKETFKKDEIIRLIADADILVPSFSVQTDKEIISAGKKLQLIANYGVGYNNIDVDCATQNGIVVTNTPHSVLEPTAELCFALILAVARKVGYCNTKLHNREYTGWGIFDELGVPLYGQTLGIYGMGRIGQAVARRAVASGMKIIYHNRRRLDEAIEKLYNASYVDFDTLLKESDVISLNAPATKENYHLFSTDEFKKMKNTGILINTGRGLLVDEQALIEALNKEEIFGAGLDVFEKEPKIPEGLLDCPSAVLTPHVGTGTYAGRIEMQIEVANNILGFYEGREITRVN